MDRRRVDKKKKNRIRFERLMAHLGYSVSVLIIWGFCLWIGKVLLTFFIMG